MIDLRKTCEDEIKKSSTVMLEFPWENKMAYAYWLVQTYHMVCYSTRLVALAGAYCDLSQGDLHSRFVDHSKEERGHDKIAIADLKALGYGLTDIPQLYQSAAMYQVQYFWIQHKKPVSFFGYTMALEGLAAEYGKQIHRKIEDAHSAKASRFIKLHAEDDIEHSKEAHKKIDFLSAEDRVLVKQNLELSCEIYRGMLREIVARTSSIPLRSAQNRSFSLEF